MEHWLLVPVTLYTYIYTNILARPLHVLCSLTQALDPYVELVPEGAMLHSILLSPTNPLVPGIKWTATHIATIEKHNTHSACVWSIIHATRALQLSISKPSNCVQYMSADYPSCIRWFCVQSACIYPMSSWHWSRLISGFNAPLYTTVARILPRNVLGWWLAYFRWPSFFHLLLPS